MSKERIKDVVAYAVFYGFTWAVFLFLFGLLLWATCITHGTKGVAISVGVLTVVGVFLWSAVRIAGKDFDEGKK